MTVDEAIKQLCEQRRCDDLAELAFEVINAYQCVFVKIMNKGRPVSDDTDAQANREAGEEIEGLLKEFAVLLAASKASETDR